MMSEATEDQWAQLPVDDVVDLLSSDELNVPDERSVLDAALKWLNHDDEDHRRRHAVRVLAAVKLPLLSPQVRFIIIVSTFIEILIHKARLVT